MRGVGGWEIQLQFESPGVLWLSGGMRYCMQGEVIVTAMPPSPYRAQS